jgi:hypothetical protein
MFEHLTAKYRIISLRRNLSHGLDIGKVGERFAALFNVQRVHQRATPRKRDSKGAGAGASVQSLTSSERTEDAFHFAA